MQRIFRRRFRYYVRRLKRLADPLVGGPAVWLLKLLRRTDPDHMAQRAGKFMRMLGPFLREHRIGRANLAPAFPEKSPREIEQILAGVWDKPGSCDRRVRSLRPAVGLRFRPAERGPHRVQREIGGIVRAARDDGKPALVFAAHLGNWELPPLAATAYGLPAAVVYRPPNVGPVANAVLSLRAGSMGELISSDRGAPFRVARALDEGKHVGMLVDQHFSRGIDVTFFGRRCKANPLIARLARHFDCPIHGVRVVQLPGGRFRPEITEALEPPRDAEGRIDVHGTMQAINLGGRGLGARASRAMALAAPALAGEVISYERHIPVLIRVHSRLIRRCVFWSCAVIV